MQRRVVMSCVRSRAISWLLVSALVAGGLGGPATASAEPRTALPAAAAPRSLAGEGWGAADALAAAAESGSPVEATALKTETLRVVATPQGSLVLESYAAPRWAKGPDGAWRRMDLTLRMTSQGGVAPAAALVDVSFSTGGSGPAVRLPVDGGEVLLSWPGTLPALRLEGDSAVYESVLPGVDLRLRALVDGFTWVLVVKSAEAAANPALGELRFGLETTGSLVKRARTGGGFDVVDATGQQVVSAGSGLMWDSSGLASPTQATTSNGWSAFAAGEGQDVLREVPDLSRKAELSTTVQGDELVILTDSALLRGGDTAYPVVIDPWTTINKLRWGYASSANATRDDGVARVASIRRAGVFSGRSSRSTCRPCRARQSGRRSS